MTTVAASNVGRPLDETMFADITAASVTFQPAVDGGVVATFDDAASPLTDEQKLQVVVRMSTADAAGEAALMTLSTFAASMNNYLTLAQTDSAAWAGADQADKDAIVGRLLSSMVDLATALKALAAHLGLGAS